MYLLTIYFTSLILTLLLDTEPSKTELEYCTYLIQKWKLKNV